MKEEALKKINKMGKVGAVITNIFKVFIIIGIVCMIIVGIGMVVMPKGFIKYTYKQEINAEVDMQAIGQTLSPEVLENMHSDNDSVTFSVNGVPIEGESVTADGDVLVVNQSNNAVEFDIHDAFWRFFVIAIELGFGLVSFIFAHKLCKAVETCITPFEENVIKSMKRFSYSLIPWVFNGLSEDVFSSNYHLIEINLTMVIVVLAMLALTYIFQYGAILQQESDETL